MNTNLMPSQRKKRQSVKPYAVAKFSHQEGTAENQNKPKFCPGLLSVIGITLAAVLGAGICGLNHSYILNTNAIRQVKKPEAAGKEKEFLFDRNTVIATLQNIPTDSTYYTKAINRTEIKVIARKQSSQTSKDLKKICGGKPKICRYKITDNKIIVTLLSNYVKIVRKTDQQANEAADQNAQTGLIRHIDSLEDALKTVSNNANLQLQIYFDNGVLIQTYTPRQQKDHCCSETFSPLRVSILKD
jgi:hypothetical protein